MPRIADRYAGAAMGLSAAAGALAAYLLTLAPGVVWAGAGIDSGDLVAAVAVGGVPHPTGYPTLMLLGLAVRAIPLGDLALRLNVLTALAAAGSLIPLGLLAARLRPRAGTALPLPEAAAGAAVLTLYGLAPLVWSNAIVTEVYALASLLLWSALYAAVRARAEQATSGRRARWAASAGVLLGLGVGAHLTVALGGPALAAVLLGHRPRSREAWRFAALAAVGFAAGCAVYVYLPIAAALDPPINWGAPTTPERFWAVVSGEIYRSRLGGSDVGAAAAKAAWLLGELVRQLTWVLLPLLAVGGASLTRRNLVGHSRDGMGGDQRPDRRRPLQLARRPSLHPARPCRGRVVVGGWCLRGRKAGDCGRGRCAPAGRGDSSDAACHDGGHPRHRTRPGSLHAGRHARRGARPCSAGTSRPRQRDSDRGRPGDLSTLVRALCTGRPQGRDDRRPASSSVRLVSGDAGTAGRHSNERAAICHLLAAGQWPADRPLVAVDIQASGIGSADVLATVRQLSGP